MKATDIPKIDQAWWNKNKPATLKSTGLGKAMAAYQDSRAKQTKLASSNAPDFGDVANAFEKAEGDLEDLGEAVTKALSACSKTLHADCITVLAKLKKDVLSAERRKLSADRDEFTKDAKAEAARVLGAMEGLLRLTTDFSHQVERTVEEVGLLEDRLTGIRSSAAKAMQTNVVVDQDELKEARTTAQAIQEAARTMTIETDRISRRVSSQTKEILSDGLSAFEPKLKSIRDRIEYPIDIVETKSLARLDEAAARSVKALAGIESLAVGAADVREEFLGMLHSFNERAILRSDAISGNLRSTGGTLDGVDMDLINRAEADKPDRSLVANAALKLQSAAKSLGSIKISLQAFRKDLDRFSESLPDFAVPKDRKFRPGLEDLLRLSQGADTDEADYKKLSDKAQRLGRKLKEALNTPKAAVS